MGVLTEYGEVSCGTDGRMSISGPHLALVVGVIMQGGVKDMEMMGSVPPITLHLIAGIPRNGPVKT